METRITVLIFRTLTSLLVLTGPGALGQSAGVIDTVYTTDSTIILPRPISHPTLLLIRSLEGTTLTDSIDYHISDSSRIHLLHPRWYNQIFTVQERSLSPILAGPATWIDTNLVKSDYLIKSLPSSLQSEAAFPAWSNISYSGHFGRGINIGNNQNTTLNSNFDLQLRGSLPHGIEVVGSLSDNSIPIQPEGNSQRLQEFDKVFIQLTKDNATLIAGDHEIRSPASYFMKYYKKTKGVFAGYTSKTSSGWEQESSVNYAVSKGKFQRTTIQVEEGNQGPYRVASEANNLFVVVLAGTERVYLDGQLLQRGELNDYTIDYNLGEITFTPRIYVSATSRIIVEYEYAEQNYLRSLFTGHTGWSRKGWDLRLHIYSEQDGKNAFQNNILTPENEAILAEAGDDVENLTGTSIVPWEGGFEEGVVLYQLVDSMGFIGILRHVKEPLDVGLYTAGFSYVGEGNGDYVPAGDFTNGEVYHWVAPNTDGTSNGSYAPITRLQAPRQQQMFGFAARKSWGENGENTIYSEWSLTNEDLNRFSSSDRNDNVGWAQNSGFSWGLNLDTARQQTLRILGNMEWRKATFSPISTYRPVEFDRNWNYQTSDTSGNERLYHIGLQYTDRRFQTGYSFENFHAAGKFSGERHQMEVNWAPGSVILDISESLTKTQSPQSVSTFSRPSASFNWLMGESNQLKFSIGYQGEYNVVRDKLNDTLSLASMRWDRGLARMEWNNNHSLTLSSRTDYQVGAENFLRSYRTNDLQMETGIYGDQGFIRWIATLRHLTSIREQAEIRDDQKGWNILGQLLFSRRFFDNGWINQGEFSLSNGKEPRRQFQYIKVETGKGQYKYVDVNQDSIQQLNEFFPAVYPDERNYIRVTTLENALISTFNYNFKWSWNVDISKWTDHTFWSKWSTENSMQIENKQQKSAKVRLWNIPDTSLISSRQNILTNLYFNRGGSKFQEHIGYWMRKQKDFLNTGFETYDTYEYFSKSTLFYSSTINSLVDVKRRRVTQSANSFVEKNFSLRFWELRHKLRWMLNQKMELEFETGWIGGKEKAGNHQTGILTNELSWQFRPNLKWSAQCAVDYSRVKYEAEDINLSLEHVMMSGLRPGGNLLWETNIQRRLPNNLVVTLRYHGRKTGGASIIHTGTVQANLLF